MSHPVYPTFPTSPTPVLGQVFTATSGSVWVYTDIGWAKKIIVLTSNYPIYEGLLVEDKP